MEKRRKVIFSFLFRAGTSDIRIMCSVLVSMLKEGCGEFEKAQKMATRRIKGLENMLYSKETWALFF